MKKSITEIFGELFRKFERNFDDLLVFNEIKDKVLKIKKRPKYGLSL